MDGWIDKQIDIKIFCERITKNKEKKKNCPNLKKWSSPDL